MAVPLVSVVIPVFNCERYIAAAVESVLRQSFADFEVVVLDNASTDGTVDVVRRFDDPRIRLLCNGSNIGAAGNFNRGLQEARGQFIKLLPADDLLYPRCLERQLVPLKRPNVALVCCGRDVIDEQGRRLLSRLPGFRGQHSGAWAIRRMVCAGTNLFGEPGAVMFRADLVEAVGGFDPKLAYVIDVDMWCRLLEHGDVYGIAEPLCAFRVSPISWSVALRSDQGRQYREFLHRLYQEPLHGLRPRELWQGSCRASFQAFARAVFYRFFVRQEAGV